MSTHEISGNPTCIDYSMVLDTTY